MRKKVKTTKNFKNIIKAVNHGWREVAQQKISGCPQEVNIELIDDEKIRFLARGFSFYKSFDWQNASIKECKEFLLQFDDFNQTDLDPSHSMLKRVVLFFTRTTSGLFDEFINMRKLGWYDVHVFFLRNADEWTFALNMGVLASPAVMVYENGEMIYRKYPVEINECIAALTDWSLQNALKNRQYYLSNVCV